MGREELEEEHGRVWNTEELGTDFQVHSFLAPFIMVTNLETNKKGIMMFQDMPRFYFGFEESS